MISVGPKPTENMPFVSKISPNPHLTHLVGPSVYLSALHSPNDTIRPFIHLAIFHIQVNICTCYPAIHSVHIQKLHKNMYQIRVMNPFSINEKFKLVLSFWQFNYCGKFSLAKEENYIFHSSKQVTNVRSCMQLARQLL